MMKWFCEYSAVQKCFHVAPAGECMEDNLEMLRTGETPSFVPLGEFDSRETAVRFSEKMRDRLVQEGC